MMWVYQSGQYRSYPLPVDQEQPVPTAPVFRSIHSEAVGDARLDHPEIGDQQLGQRLVVRRPTI